MSQIIKFPNGKKCKFSLILNSEILKNNRAIKKWLRAVEKSIAKEINRKSLKVEF